MVRAWCVHGACMVRAWCVQVCCSCTRCSSTRRRRRQARHSSWSLASRCTWRSTRADGRHGHGHGHTMCVEYGVCVACAWRVHGTCIYARCSTRVAALRPRAAPAARCRGLRQPDDAAHGGPLLGDSWRQARGCHGCRNAATAARGAPDEETTGKPCGRGQREDSTQAHSRRRPPCWPSARAEVGVMRV